MVQRSRSFVVRFYAVNGELRARVTDADASRSWTVGDGASARALETSLVRDDPDEPHHANRRKDLP